MTLEEIRARIDGIDRQLLPLLTERMDCSRQVAEVKRGTGESVFHPDRERDILKWAEAGAGEYADETRLVFASLLDASRAVQHRMLGSGKEIRDLVKAAPRSLPHGNRIACQGASGAYSHQAALRLFPGCRPDFHKSFGGVFRALETGAADFGLLPVENSFAGSVSEVYDLILKYRYFIVAATTVRVRHCLAVPRGADFARVKEIYSHPQALAQCSEFISSRGVRAVPYSNTAAAAEMAAEKGGNLAVICSEQAAEHFGLQILSRDIQNSRNNRTRFVAICREPAIPEDAQKISLCFSLPHTTGSLCGVLSRFAAGGLNLTKIESRPIADKNFEYDFYLDFTGNLREPRTLALIAALHDELPRFSFLGNYRELE